MYVWFKEVIYIPYKFRDEHLTSIFIVDFLSLIFEFRIMGNRGSRSASSESTNPLQSRSTPASSSPVDSVHPFPPRNAETQEEIDPVEQIRPSKRLRSSESLNLGHHVSTLSSPHTMEPSQPSPVDSAHPFPSRNAETHEKIDPVEQVRPLKRFKSSESMNPCRHGSTPSSPPTIQLSQPYRVDSVHPSPSMDAIELIRETYEKTNPAEQIDPLIRFVENQLNQMNTPSEVGFSEGSLEAGSSKGLLETVGDGTELAAKTIVTISTEAEKLSESQDAMQAMGSVTLRVMRGLGELHWVFMGLSMAAFAVESYMSAGATENECRKLLLKILELAKDLKQYSKLTHEDGGKLCDAVGTIVEGAVICSDYMKGEKFLRFWSATRAAAQLEKTNQQLRDVRVSLLDFYWKKYYGGNKDVFLSHSGKQKNFVRQLHRDLSREHISCFFDEDDKSLPLGQKFPPLIFKAAETCKIAVLVLSKEFVSSKWPMLELSAFISAMKSGKNANLKLLPIFFMISPKELSHITKDSPEWHKLEVSNDTKDKWQDALKEVRSINGLSFGENGNEVDCRDKVVKAICCLLKGIGPESSLQLLDFNPVGIEEQVQEVKEQLDMEGAQSALAVIVCGFGGVGKTTLAASVVQSLNWFSTDFKFCMVVIDQKSDKISHIIKLQKHIISKLGGVKLDFQDPFEGRCKIKEILKNKCSLLFIDNVVDNNYIRDLLPQDLRPCDHETKLRILVTSREKNVKAELNIMCKEYEMKGLSDVASKTLLLKTILQSESQVVQDITLDEERMINEVAAACRGVPLLLTVFGKHLRVERDKDSYEEALHVLREGNLDSYRDEDLGTKLLFVYRKIKDVEVKEAFLDICTYFNGWKWNLVADIVDIFRLRDLHRRLLVSKSGSDEVIVHDILRLMGMKEASLTRFSNYEELSDALEDNLDGLGNIKGISLVRENRLITIPSAKLEAMHQSLRVLMFGDWVTLDGPPCDRAFRNLRYLHLGDIVAFPFKDPSKLQKLRAVLNRSKPGMNLSHLPSSLKHISYEVPNVECDEFAKLPFQNLSSLKSFIVQTQKSVELPEELHLPASLVDLDLNRCRNLPKHIGHLTSLESLILDRSDLKCLPRGFDKLKKLKHLSMRYCSKLDSLFEELGMLSSLEALRMADCQNLRALPKSLGGLLSLKKLKLRRSINLQLLPGSLGELRIHSLKLISLVNLQELPNSFGNMSLLKDLRLESCHSLMSLPDSFVQLKMLETLKIIMCTKLSIVPKDFGQLRCLKHMTVKDCHLLKELPHGFGALPALKTFKLRRCKSFVNLPRDFTELPGLELLVLEDLPLISWMPDGFGKLKKLRILVLAECFQLKTLSDDFENMTTLEQLTITNCSELDGAMMEKIVKLQQCYMAHIQGSRKLVEKWKHMHSEIEHLIAVLVGDSIKDSGRAIMVALLNGKCVEVNTSTDQLMERSSLLVGMEEGTRVMVVLIVLPIQMQSHQHQTLQRFVEMAREASKNNGSSKLQIVCARKNVQIAEEERADGGGIRQLSLPEGSCAIPPTESKRLKIITYCCDPNNYHDNKLSFFIANVVVGIGGRKSFENLKFIREKQISGHVVEEPPPWEIREPMNKQYNSIEKFIKSIYPPEDEDESETEDAAGESKTREFIKALKGNGIHHLLTRNNTSEVMVDDLHGKTIGFIICNFQRFESIKLQQIYLDLQQEDSNFIAIWIPAVWPGLFESCGHGSYTRLIGCMPWATFPLPQMLNVERRDPRFVVLDKEGHIANHDAWDLLLAWGVKSYPFTQHTIRDSFLSMESESCLEFLLHGMSIVGRKPMKSKMTFLYAQHPRNWLKEKCKLEELTHICGCFEVLYVGQRLFALHGPSDIEDRKQDYENATQDMRWPSLSFSDMIMFWYRCKYLANQEGSQLNKECNIMMEKVHGLACELYNMWLVLVDNEGLVTRGGYDVLQMICEPWEEISEGEGMVKDEVLKSLSRGECSPVVKTFFRDEIDNLPLHPQHLRHRIASNLVLTRGMQMCSVCDVGLGWERGGDQERSYRCSECEWKMCGSCWKAYATQQAQQLLCATDN